LRERTKTVRNVTISFSLTFKARQSPERATATRGRGPIVLYIYICIICIIYAHIIYVVYYILVRVPGYRSRGPGSIPGATRFREK
jgi:hypothetical protein